MSKQKATRFISKGNSIYLLSVFSIISLNFYQYFSLNNPTKYLFTDDLWVLIGSNYESVFEKFLCCSVTSPFASIFFEHYVHLLVPILHL